MVLLHGTISGVDAARHMANLIASQSSSSAAARERNLGRSRSDTNFLSGTVLVPDAGCCFDLLSLCVPNLESVPESL